MTDFEDALRKSAISTQDIEGAPERIRSALLDTEVDSMTLVEFLRARLDEDEQLARGCLPGPWKLHGPPAETTVSACGRSVAVGWLRDLRHIARHDPARVLAEVEAKRRIIEVILGEEDHGDIGWASDQVLRLLALPYADRPGYREEWRP